MRYTNPIIPGFHPDPSVCRVGDDYYLVTSSFEYFPCIPIFHSRDLVHWKQIGNCLTRKSQIDLSGTPSSCGIWAPTIRYHNGLFYVAVSDASRVLEGRIISNFMVTAEDPGGSWSDPVYVNQPGIDPSLYFDENGECYYATDGGFDNKGRTCLIQSIIDPDTGEILDGPKNLWAGAGGRNVEAPHIYSINGRYYLLAAEGGTEYGHRATVARSDSPWGPWESCPFNPVLSNQYPDGLPLQCVGHGDFVQTLDGSWYIVFLAVRPSAGLLHHLGRETCLMPVEWRDGWPYIGNALEICNCSLPEHIETNNALFTFNGTLSPEWVSLRRPVESVIAEKGILRIVGNGVKLGDLCPAAMFLRQTQFDLSVQFEFSCSLSEGERAGVTVFCNQERHYDLCVIKREGRRYARVEKTVSDIQMCAWEREYTCESLILRIEADRNRYLFFVNGENIASGVTSLLSKESNVFTFTGVMIGLFAEGYARASFQPKDKYYGIGH